MAEPTTVQSVKQATRTMSLKLADSIKVATAKVVRNENKVSAATLDGSYGSPKGC
jgi:hypothetical protein